MLILTTPYKIKDKNHPMLTKYSSKSIKGDLNIIYKVHGQAEFKVNSFHN